MPIPEIDEDECSGCGICVDSCESQVLDIVGNTAAVVNEDNCIGCGECMEECPMGAINVEED
jgi:NAD-dependent dihydropyrimidine dehydrogenase PreA subunit